MIGDLEDELDDISGDLEDELDDILGDLDEALDRLDDIGYEFICPEDEECPEVECDELDFECVPFECPEGFECIFEVE